MGMFTTAVALDGTGYQIKSGYDDCEKYKIGDKVNQYIIKEFPGEGKLLDDVYEGYAGKEKYAWVVIKDAILVDIVPFSRQENDDDDEEMQPPTPSLYQQLKIKYNIEPPARELWSEDLWREKEKQEAEWKAESDAFHESIKDLPPGERFARAMARPISRVFNYSELMRNMFKIEPITTPEDKPGGQPIGYSLFGRPRLNYSEIARRLFPIQELPPGALPYYCMEPEKPTTGALQEYLQLRDQMLGIRRHNNGIDSVEEDSVLDRMDKVWKCLSKEDIEQVNRMTNEPN